MGLFYIFKKIKKIVKKTIDIVQCIVVLYRCAKDMA